MSRVAVVGAGGFGTCLAILLRGRGHAVRLWAHDPAQAEALARERVNRKYLPAARLPEHVEVSADLARALEGAEIVVSAVPTQHVRAVWSAARGRVGAGAAVLSVSKGIEVGTDRLASEALAEALGGGPVAVLAGPCHAEEVAQGIPSSVVVGAPDAELARRLQEALGTERFRVYTNPDVRGIELGGALKNVIALAAGICDGLGFGDNTKAALLTRGLAEMARLGVALGARRETFYGLAGIGDLMTTAFSRHGRNREMGERIGRGMKLEDALRATSKVAEGVWTTKPALDLARQRGVEVPITAEVEAVLFRGRDPRAGVAALMARPQRDEAGPV
jgi:glycerol-3-phosphate dehydrogenase (NAD(P)+)